MPLTSSARANRAILAVAGGRKTQLIVDECSRHQLQSRLAITFTIAGQDVLQSRLYQACPTDGMPDVTGWYTFLIGHIIKPYLPDLFPGQHVAGLHFIEGTDNSHKKKGITRFFDPDGYVYSTRVAELAARILQISEPAVIDRLEHIYDEIYIDEVQDLVHYDLTILETLLQSCIRITMVGDLRQTILSTSRAGSKNKQYDSLRMLDWFNEQVTHGRLQLERRTTSWRCNQAICDLADTIFASYDFPKTISAQIETTSHDGVFFVAREHVLTYIHDFDPAVYRYSKRTKVPNDITATNIGLVKGATVDRVLLFPAATMLHFLVGETTTIAPKTASELYVAITRAKYSVAVVVENINMDLPGMWVPYTKPHDPDFHNKSVC